MKKFLSLTLFVCTLLMVGCTSTSEDVVSGVTEQKNIKPSEVLIYSGGNPLNMTRAINTKDEVGYSIPDAEGRYQVFYYIRIDGNIPGENEVNLPASAYFPRTSTGKTMVSELNRGYVNANVDWKSNFKFSKYVYSTDGSAVQSVILEEPTLEDMVNANKGNGDDFSGYLENQDKLHFLWYACKKQDSDHVWHIDGILTSKDRTNIAETDYGKEIMDKYTEYGMEDDKGDVTRKAHVEVDVHQQEHNAWNEIKTSIHLRDTVDVEVFLPIGYEEMADDFDIRAGHDYEYITENKECEIMIGEETFKLEVSIQHEEGGIRITVKPNKEALIAARKEYGDGITFEVHSYVTSGIPADAIWAKLKETTCSVTPYTTLRGQITSALYDDEVKLK